MHHKRRNFAGINRFPLAILLIIFLWGFPLHSHKSSSRFQSFSVAEGLPQNSVFSILQDRQGFLWVGTEQGLNRFDGYNFVVHQFQRDDSNSLNNNHILCTYEDNSGILWIGTDGSGLNRFDPASGQFSHHLIDPDIPDSLNNIINVIYGDNSGTIWVGTAGGGLKRFNPAKKSFTHVPLNPGLANYLNDKTVNAVYRDRRGSLWVGTNNGLKQLDPETGYLENNYNEASGSVTESPWEVFTMVEDRSGELWIGSNRGFYRLDRGAGKFVHYGLPSAPRHHTAANTVRAIYEDQLGLFWIGTDYGLHIFDRGKKTLQSFYADRDDPYSLSSNMLKVIYEDRSGALWLGSDGGGLNKLNRSGRSFNHFYSNPQDPDSSSEESVFALHEDRRGILWIGTYGDGLNGFNRRTGVVTNYRNQPGNPNSLSNNKIWAICEDRRDALWIGTDEGGMDRFDPKTGKFTRYPHQPRNPNSLGNNSVSSIIEDRRGILWIATNMGLNRFDPQTQRFTHYQTRPNDPNTLLHNMVYVLLSDRSGLLWIGTKGGLSRFDPETETFKSYPIDPLNPRNMLHHPIYSLCQDRDGHIWVGTTGGLVKFNPGNEAFSVYLQKDGLPNDVINGILEDDRGYLWCSTNRGISKYEPSTGTFRNYSREDGLQSFEFNGGAYCKSPGGELFFGGINGFNAFFPDTIKENPYVPPVVITGFKIFNEEVPIGKEVKGRVILDRPITHGSAITLDHKHYVFSFDFAALSYIHSDSNEYAYMMEGLEQTWNYSGKQRFVTYANLSPGDFVFRVKGSNNNGVWNEAGVSLDIRVLPPFWETWWFTVLLLMAAAAALLGFRRARNRLEARRRRELEDLVDQRTTALKESGEKYRDVVELAHHGIAVMQNNIIVFQNTRFAGMLGFNEQSIINRPLPDFVVPGKIDEMKLLLDRLKAENEPMGTIDTVMRHKDGKDVYMEISYRNIRYKKGPALLMFFHDTGMKTLLEAERMKSAKLESVRILAGGIAHDFNNILAIIVGNLGMALDLTGESDKVQQPLKEAEKASAKATELIRQFITLAKGGNLVSANQPVDLQTLIPDVVRSVFGDSRIQYRLDLPPDLWPVNGDSNHIKQAVKHIVINAKQAMPGTDTAKGLLQVTAENRHLNPDEVSNQTAGKYVVISFKDNGTGIAKDDLPKIFDPYFSTRNDVTQKGLGLGLAVVHSIITKHGGTIRVTSEPGQGTVVSIHLPAS
ncbi:MAG: PAS domain S-box protein [bacterium]|nr:PAS domain S-box protein [bacterium]